MFVKKMEKENIYFVRLNKGQTYFWHYIAVNKNKLPLMDKLSDGGVIDIAQYGTILDSGWGLFPNEEMQKKYSDIKL